MKIILNAVAQFLARPAVVDYLIRRAKKTPYTHIIGPDGSTYMERYWLFNPVSDKTWFPISARLHFIRRHDGDRHLHDHPWNARTFILRGWYHEVREGADGWFHERQAGDTAALRYGEYHRITKVPDEGVWTLFISGKYRGTWGFKVDGVKVPWRQYLGIK